VVSFTLLPLYPGKRTPETLSIDYVGLSRYGSCGEEKNLADFRLMNFSVRSIFKMYEDQSARGSVVASRKVAGSSPYEVDFSIDIILPAALWPWCRLSL
jgi:hypothetical protein